MQNEQLLNGSGEKVGLLDLEHRLKMISRERGRVWRGVQPAGEVDDQGVVQVEIAQPTPHGLEKDAIVYVFEAGGAFEAGEVNPTDSSAGRQYLGEFRVTEAGERLASSQGPWSLYETMPADRHKLYAGLEEEQLRQLLPADSLDEYLRHGTPATADDDEWHKIGLNENDERVGPENLDQAVKFLYDRPLRDYAYLFSELAQQRVVLQASRQAVAQDLVKLAEALQSAEQLGTFREQQRTALASDLTGMQGDRLAIETHRDLVQHQLTHAKQLIERLLARNSELADRLTQRQMGLLESINRAAPAPSGR